MIISNHYQPIVNKNLRVVGFEVLLRGELDGHIITGDKCLNEAVRTEGILNLTLRQISDCVTLLDVIPNVFFSINISMEFLENPLTINFLKKIPPEKRKHINFEILETTTFTNNIKLINNSIAIRLLGFSFSLDDFFSNKDAISPLIELGINSIKIDIDMVRLFTHNKNIEHMLRTIVYYCQISGGNSIAEGIENAETFYELRGIGVSFFQGFLFSDAISSNELILKYKQSTPWLMNIQPPSQK